MKSIIYFIPVFFCFGLLLSCSSSDDGLSNPKMEMEQEDDENNNDDSLPQGDFVADAHPTSGTATVNADGDTLYFMDFMTDDEPNLDVYLATDTSAGDYVSLGDLQGIEGDFDYNIPSSVDLDKYNYVLIWCVDFSVNFGYAVLE
ncbi:DM13 domain-containing protein [Galbibacter sp. EGI 63066]|uniref:DM13 domain-containing protein n=1 Tax=Galbibacter sp. EGI 63066 TaxID=2993559 RepID=UPI002249418F|nr:DM13 domain-containing protein [Galbibacter sp. EGI 63066]MCX2680141.1 DM13 domain-containing protein [Galbibacter sp. EGI 63066]